MSSLILELEPLVQPFPCFVDTCNEPARFRWNTIEDGESDEDVVCGPHLVACIAGMITIYAMDE